MPPRLRLPQPLQGLLKRNVFTPASHRTLIAAPKANSGPLMERRSDRALPSVTSSSHRWLRSLPIFALVMGVSMFAIFNYQKQSSSIVSSTLYSLRTNARARELLGDEVYFASQIPWIHGEMNQLHGRIDIRFWVKGTRQMALMRFKSSRKQRMGYVSFAPMAYYFEETSERRTKNGLLTWLCSSQLQSGVSNWRTEE